MLSKSQMMLAFKNGWTDRLAHELLTYGTIEADARWQEGEQWHRATLVRLHGMQWDIQKQGGEVRQIGYR